MKNKEKFAKEIIELACNGCIIAVSKYTRKPVNCDNILCDDCAFSDEVGCNIALREWAESEYIEKPVISKRDKAFLEYIGEECKFIARDENGELFVYIEEPHKLVYSWIVDCYENVICEIDTFNIDLPMIKWEDCKPWLIEDLKKLEVVEEYG